MASLIRGPLTIRPTHSIPNLRPSQRCNLSTSRKQCAQGVSKPNMYKNMPKQPALATRMKKMRRSEIPTDFGLMPATYIRPCGDLPSWFSQPSVRAQLEWLYLKQGFTSFLNYVVTNRWTVPKDHLTGKRKKIPLRLRERYEVAQKLHTELYTALAAGDRNTISNIACSGLVNQQLGRIERSRLNGNPPETWTVKYRGWTLPSKLYFTIQTLIPSCFKSILVVADRQTYLPAGPGIQLRQVVLRIDSTQTLDRNDGSDPVTKNMREYMVMQQTVVEEEFDDWKIWGTLSPSSIEDAQEIIKMSKSESGTMMDRLRAMMPGM